MSTYCMPIKNENVIKRGRIWTRMHSMGAIGQCCPTSN